MWMQNAWNALQLCNIHLTLKGTRRSYKKACKNVFFFALLYRSLPVISEHIHITYWRFKPINKAFETQDVTLNRTPTFLDPRFIEWPICTIIQCQIIICIKSYLPKRIRNRETLLYILSRYEQRCNGQMYRLLGKKKGRCCMKVSSLQLS